MKPILNVRINTIKVWLIVSITLFFASLVLTYYERSLGNYLINTTFFLTSISFIGTIRHRLKNENAQPVLKRNFTGIACIISFILTGVSIALTLMAFNTAILFYIIDAVLLCTSISLLVIAFRQEKANISV